MLPCQTGCAAYCSGCHKSCPQWQAFQERQRVLRQDKKEYLHYYNDLTSTVTRQFRALGARRPAW